MSVVLGGTAVGGAPGDESLHRRAVICVPAGRYCPVSGCVQNSWCHRGLTLLPEGFAYPYAPSGLGRAGSRDCDSGSGQFGATGAGGLRHGTR